jgi:hypothetical protein
VSRSAADIWVTGHLPGIEAAQTTAINSKGRYHQCLESHSVVPDFAAIPDRQADKTSDNNEGWSNLVGAVLDPADPMPASVSITVYHRGSNKGWTLRVKAKETDQEYLRTISYGPQAADRTTPWTVIPSSPGPKQQTEAPARKRK